MATAAGDVVSVSFQEPIGASDALRTASYSKRLTVTPAATGPQGSSLDSQSAQALAALRRRLRRWL